MSDEIISKKIKTLRKARGLTQEQLAEKLGVQRATVSNYEIGRRSPHIKELEKIADVLGVSLEYFGVGGNEIHDLIARAKYVFENPEISPNEKSDVYKKIMRLYLEMDE